MCISLERMSTRDGTAVGAGSTTRWVGKVRGRGHDSATSAPGRTRRRLYPSSTRIEHRHRWFLHEISCLHRYALSPSNQFADILRTCFLQRGYGCGRGRTVRHVRSDPTVPTVRTCPPVSPALNRGVTVSVTLHRTVPLHNPNNIVQTNIKRNG